MFFHDNLVDETLKFWREIFHLRGSIFYKKKRVVIKKYARILAKMFMYSSGQNGMTFVPHEDRYTFDSISYDLFTLRTLENGHWPLTSRMI